MKWSTWLRILGALFVFAWGWYIMTGFRTTQFGNDFFVLLVLLMGILFVFPFTVMPFIGLKPKYFFTGTLLLFFTTFSFSILWATTEEIVVAKKNNYPHKDLVINRAWPFQHHVMFYDGKRWSGQD